MLKFFSIMLFANSRDQCHNLLRVPENHCINDTSPYAGGVQVGSPEPPFKINDIHSMHVVEVLV